MSHRFLQESAGSLDMLVAIALVMAPNRFCRGSLWEIPGEIDGSQGVEGRNVWFNDGSNSSMIVESLFFPLLHRCTYWFESHFGVFVIV